MPNSSTTLITATIGTTPQIPNEAAAAASDHAFEIDPLVIKAYKDSVATQLNKQSAKGRQYEDLTDRIADIRIGTTAQGASTLQVDLDDPMWSIFMGEFITVDETGYMWPPIDVNFPPGSKAWWRLCQRRRIWDAEGGGAANVTLTFEDRSVGFMREYGAGHPGAITSGQPNQTLGAFLKSLVDKANSALGLRGDEEIKFVLLIDQTNDPNATPPITYQQTNPESPIKRNPNKPQQGLDAASQSVADAVKKVVQSVFPDPASPKSVQHVEQTWADQHNEERQNAITHAPPHGGEFQ